MLRRHTGLKCLLKQHDAVRSSEDSMRSDGKPDPADRFPGVEHF
jgi:hypothetical protein